MREERKEVSGTEDADPLAQYVWHPYYIDALAVRSCDEDTDGNLAENNDRTHYYLQDANCNMTASEANNLNVHSTPLRCPNVRPGDLHPGGAAHLGRPAPLL